MTPDEQRAHSWRDVACEDCQRSKPLWISVTGVIGHEWHGNNLVACPRIAAYGSECERRGMERVAKIVGYYPKWWSFRSGNDSADKLKKLIRREIEPQEGKDGNSDKA